MNLYIVRTNYMDSGIYGIYSSMRRAQQAMEHFLKEDENIIGMTQTDPYAWLFTTKANEQFGVEIIHDVLDYEFVEGVIKG